MIMTKLDCNVVGCSYNQNKMCTRENITVGGRQANKPSETVCESFNPRGTNTMTNLDCNGPKAETNIACNAVTCMYNNNNKCTAKHIQIAGMKAMTSGETECGTFQSK